MANCADSLQKIFISELCFNFDFNNYYKLMIIKLIFEKINWHTFLCPKMPVLSEVWVLIKRQEILLKTLLFFLVDELLEKESEKPLF